MGSVADSFIRKVRRAIGLAETPGSLPDLMRLGRYRATVVAQNGDGTLDVQPEDARLSGLKNVPVRVGIPGAVATVAPGGVVLLGWERGDPSRPFCEPSWESGVTVLKLVLNAQMIELGGSGGDALVKKTDFNNHTHLAGSLTAPAGTAGGPVTGASGAPSSPTTGTTNVQGL